MYQAVADFFQKDKIEDCAENLRNRADIDRLRRYLDKVDVRINYRQTGRKRYKIEGVANYPSDRDMINMDNGQRISVAEYFTKTYNLRLRYPWLPCVVVNRKRDEKIPMELCMITENQVYAAPLSDMQTAELIKETAVKPFERFEHIQQGLE